MSALEKYQQALNGLPASSVDYLLTNGKYDISKERALPKARYYWHVTRPEYVDSILKKGVVADKDGMIFVITDRLVMEEIALHQIGVNPYALFYIDNRGITGKVVKDRVAEYSAPYHRIIIQDKISKRHLILWERKILIDMNEPTAFEVFKMQHFERLTKKEAIRVWHTRMEALRCQA